MKLIAQQIVLIFCITTFFVGCDQQMGKPIMEEIFPPPTQSPLERAQAAMERVNQRRTEAHQKAEAAGDFFSVFTDSEKIFKEELGFRKGFWIKLVDIYSIEKSDDSIVTEGFTTLQDTARKNLVENTFGMIFFEYIRTFDPLIVEYLRLSYEYPTQSEEALLTRFRESVRDGKVSIVFPENF